MSDTRFIILGVGLIFAGIIVLTVFSTHVDEITLQEEFPECYEYHTDAPPTEIDCDTAFQSKMIIFAIVALLIICGIVSQLDLILFLNVLVSAIIVFVRIERISSTTFGTSESKICFF